MTADSDITVNGAAGVADVPTLPCTQRRAGTLPVLWSHARREMDTAVCTGASQATRTEPRAGRACPIAIGLTGCTLTLWGTKCAPTTLPSLCGVFSKRGPVHAALASTPTQHFTVALRVLTRALHAMY